MKATSNREIFDILGIKVDLYVSRSHMTKSVDGSYATQVGTPPIIRAIDRGDFLKAAEELKKAASKAYRQAAATTIFARDKVKILKSSVRLSNQLGEDEYGVDKEGRVSLSPTFAEKYDIDCDGDPIIAIELELSENKDNPETMAAIVKFPPKEILFLRKRAVEPDAMAPISDERYQEAMNFVADPDKNQAWAALKTYSNPPIGQICLRYWSIMLKEVVDSNPETEYDFLEAIGTTVERWAKAYQNDLEGNGMKAASKGNGSLRPEVFDWPVNIIEATAGSLYATKGCIGRADVTNKERMRDLLELDPTQITFGDPSIQKEAEMVPEGWTNRPNIGDRNLVLWLIKARRLFSQTIESRISSERGLPSATVLTLWCPEKSAPCALTWTKDSGEQHSGYCTMLFPTWCWDCDANQWVIMEPLEHMSYWLSRHFQCPKITSSRYLEVMWKDAPQKASALENAIREYISEYGEMIPGVKNPATQLYEATKYAQFFGSQLLTVDHGSIPQWNHNVSPEWMRSITEIVHKVQPIHWASTGSNRAVRKHFLAREDGRPYFCKDSSKVHPGQMHRPGRNKSLMMRSVALFEATVAIVDTNKNIQAFITPSGVVKNTPDVDVFLRQTSADPVDNWQLVNFVSWLGEDRYVYISPDPKREAKRIGKLVCANGSRFEPAEIDQVNIIDPSTGEIIEPVDILMPIDELESKELQQAFLQDSEKKVIRMADGKVMTVHICKWKFMRSGAASENIKPRYVDHWSVSGFGGLMIASALQKFGIPFSRNNESLVAEAEKLMDASMRCYSMQASLNGDGSGALPISYDEMLHNYCVEDEGNGNNNEGDERYEEVYSSATTLPYNEVFLQPTPTEEKAIASASLQGVEYL